MKADKTDSHILNVKLTHELFMKMLRFPMPQFILLSYIHLCLWNQMTNCIILHLALLHVSYLYGYFY